MAKTLYRARTKGLDRLLKDATETERALQPAVRDAMADLGPKMQATYQRFAPRESGRMADSVYFRVHTFPGGGVQVRIGVADTVSPVTGFDYLEQTRVGRGPVHTITAPQLVLRLGRDKSGTPDVLAPVGSSVAAWTPAIDWVAAAERRARRHTSNTQRKIGTAISRRGLLRSYGA